jgi:para-nitrobenzyl esterase
MLKNALTAALIAAAPLALAAPVMAETAPAAPAEKAKLSTADTTIGDLLDNPAAKAVLDKHMPGFSSNPQVEMARGMTLRAIQPMVPDQIKAETLDMIDADLAKL